MNIHAEKKEANKSMANAQAASAQLVGKANTPHLQDNRLQAVAQKKQVEAMAAGKPIQQKNNTGLPDNLKAGVENLSGYSMDDVKVHYNSTKPAQLQALAYAQGTNIHIGPGQEKHLPHEAWHVVQQKQGRVQPTMQMKEGVAVNDDRGLEQEADVMGTAALQRQPTEKGKPIQQKLGVKAVAQRQPVIQLGGAAAVANADENLQATGRGIEGIQGLINALKPDDVKAPCYVGVMVRYPNWGNYLKAKGGHAAIQVKVNLGAKGMKYIQAGVSATGSIQIEPVFHSIKTKDGYNIKQLTKSVSKENCINVLTAIAKEIAIAQPYQERITLNTGNKTNCSLWAVKMAAIAGMQLGTVRMWVFPSPNDLQHALDRYKNTEGHELTDSKVLQADAEVVNVNVGMVPDPQFDVDDHITNNLTPAQVAELKNWAKAGN